MSICSSHRKPQLDCVLCQTTSEELFGKEIWRELREKAERAGKQSCVNCGFVFYRTTCYCPLCGRDNSGID